MHPIGDLLAVTEEGARIMWHYYDDHVRHPSTDPQWEKRAWEIYQQCMTCSERVWRLKQLRDRALRPREGDSAD